MDRAMQARRELSTARRVLEQGDPKHAAHHAAAALALEPLDAAVRNLVDELVQTPVPGLGGFLRRTFGGDRRIAPLFPDDGFAGNVAAHARAQELRGAYDEAFQLLVALAVQVPGRGFVSWARDVVEGSPAPLQVGPLLGAYGELASPTVGLLHLRPTEQRYFAEWTDLAEALITKTAVGDEIGLRMCASAFARRAGRYARAAELARSDTPNELLDLSAGLALRALGLFGEAREAFERAEAAARDPQRHAAEIARVFMAAGELTEARAWFSRVGEDSEIELTVKVLDEALDPELPRQYTPLFGAVPTYDAIRRLTCGDDGHDPMFDATTNIIPQLGDTAPPLQVEMSTSAFECPSVLAALALRCFGAPDPSDLDYEYSGIMPRPPAVEPFEPGRGATLWRMQGKLPVQAVPPPPAAVSAFVDETVTALWTRLGEGAPFMSTARAWRGLRAHPALDGLAPEDLRAAMVHPTPPPAWVDTALWVFDRQVVCALALGAQDAGRPWLASRRRDNLVSLIFGHPDWTLAAALVALREVLLDDPEVLDDARDWAVYLAERQPDQGHCPWAPALRKLLRVPGMPLDLLHCVIDYDAQEEDEPATLPDG